MCELHERFDRAHDWVHRSARALDDEDWDKVKEVTEQVLNFVDDLDVNNGIKLLAVAEILMLGAECMQENYDAARRAEGVQLSRAIH